MKTYILVLIIMLFACPTQAKKPPKKKVATLQSTHGAALSVIPTLSVILAWNANTEPNITSYRLYKGLATHTYIESINVGNTTTGSFSNLSSDTNYYFVVTATNNTGLESSFSNEVVYRTPMIITGTVLFCGTNAPLAGAKITMTGTTNGTTTTDVDGNYYFFIPSNSTFTITASKQALVPATGPINTLDVVAIQANFLFGTPIICLEAGDINQDTMINTIDVVAVQRFVLGMIGAQTGQYKFNALPPSLNFTAKLLGDVK